MNKKLFLVLFGVMFLGMAVSVGAQDIAPSHHRFNPAGEPLANFDGQCAVTAAGWVDLTNSQGLAFTPTKRLEAGSYLAVHQPSQLTISRGMADLYSSNGVWQGRAMVEYLVGVNCQPTPEPLVQVQAPASSGTCIATAPNPINLFRAPYAWNEVVATMAAGARLPVAEYRSGYGQWVSLQLPEGDLGYAVNTYLTFTGC